MRRRFNIKAQSDTRKATVSILVETDSSFMRHETEAAARDICDDVLRTLGNHFRQSRIKLS